jgi:hypothetical protein
VVAAHMRESKRRKKGGWKNCAVAISCALETGPMTSEEICTWVNAKAGQKVWKLATVNRNLSANQVRCLILPLWAQINGFQ